MKIKLLKLDHSVLLILALFLLGTASSLQGQISLNGQEIVTKYYEVAVELPDEAAMETLSEAELDVDHFHPELGTNTIVIRQGELAALISTGLEYEVLSFDVAAKIEQRNIADLIKYNPSGIGQEKTTNGFELGSMGGFYTFAEIVQQLDEMASLYPNLITPKFSLATTVEGRTIWAVKISDNPSVDESSTEAQVYFDALHHAREPASGATVINFMFHLLENYGTDPQITYLIDNREIHIIPCVNPDGYVYNQQTNPNGGGFWRKNRRVNSGSSCRGVDLNRNYDTDFGGSGTSSNPCSDSYRGTGPFSEIESQTVRDFVNSIQPPIAYTTHTSGGYWLGPDFSNGQQEFAIHAELNSDCMDENEYIYGDANLILGYVAGTTQNWMYETNGTLTWTPEIGTTGFWPSIPEIIPLVNQQIKPYEYACWVAGALADYQGFTILNSQGLSASQNLELNIEVKNKGLSKTAQNVSVTVTPENAGITAVNGTVSYGNIASRTEASNGTPFEFSVNGLPAGTLVKFYIDVSQEGVVSDRDSIYLTVGDRNVLFSDDAESGTSNWSQAGTGSNWETSNEDAYAGNNCFVDSRISHSASNNNRAFAMNSSVSLAGAANPRLEFAAKWGLWLTSDYVRLQISTNGGSSWSNVSTDAMETIAGGPGYKENERWTHQSVDLSSFIGQSVRFRFVSVQNSSKRSDGFYFDDFYIADYSDPPGCSVSGNIVSQSCNGFNTVSTADDSIAITVIATVNNGSGAYDVLLDGVEIAANVNSGNSTSFSVAASGGAANINFRDAADNTCTSGTTSTGPLTSCSPTCNDGIQNGNETDVDCGGTDCAACPTCDDGVQNGDESGVDCGGPDCAACPTCFDGIQNGGETGVDCGGPDCAACPTCFDGIQNGDETGVDCGGSCPTSCPLAGLQLEYGTLNNIGESWVTVPLANNYNSMVVVASVVMPSSAQVPVVTRVRNAAGSSFDLRVQTTSTATSSVYTIHYTVVEEGVYTLANDGIKMEAVKFNSTVTAENNNWAFESRTYQQAYSSPVVVGQIMTFNDADWSVFWASANGSRTTPPTPSSFAAGKNVGEDPDNTRANETVGYLVIEAGNGTVDGTEYTAGLGSDIVQGITNTSTGFNYNLNGLSGAQAAIVSAAAMDGNNGGWPVLYGNTPFTSSQLSLAFDEDVAGDTERAHTTEQVAYFAFGASSGGPTCNDGIQNGNETGVDCGGPDCAPCFNCNDGIQNGSETGVDCGGPDCVACPTCNDGVQNGSETGVDCGGPDCVACPTCNDGVQNGSEAGVDCGGPDCVACPSCSDGIQNGNETGVDCGGPDCAACPVNYCGAQGNNTNYEFIQAVNFNGQNNNSGNNGGYADFTASVNFSAAPGAAASVSLTPGFAGSSYNEFWRVYLDFNGDGDFTDSGELAFQGAGSSTVSGSVNIPAGAVNSIRMRVIMQWNAYATSCQTFTYGEVEDYTVTLSATGMPGGSGFTGHQSQQISAGDAWQLYPNPASDFIYLRTGYHLPESVAATFTITTVEGKTVATYSSGWAGRQDNFALPVADLLPGVYLVVIQTGESRESLRFVRKP
ncbi:hypothetical protein CEQ90_02580 [Lewinellaceae bacterium SD302]|nr:hypothetical protein CEQ90_02580 [Lewinellaceae bacterium SD302]